MCLAPCFAGCTKEEYDAEVGRVVETLASAGESLVAQIGKEREAASEALDFERAAAFHKRFDKVSSQMRGFPEIARRIQDLDAVILQRSAEEKTVAVFPVLAGILREPTLLRFAELASEPRSVEAILRRTLAPQMNADEYSSESRDSADPSVPNMEERSQEPDSTWRERFGLRSVPPELSEHLSLVARWFYSKPRDGEIFFRAADWPYRRILRACSRLLSPPPDKAAAAPPQP